MPVTRLPAASTAIDGADRHQRLRQRQHDDLGEHQPALVDAIPERHEQQDADQQAAEGERRYPARRRGVRLELRGDRRQHRRLIVNAAGHDESGHDQQRDETAMLALGRGQIGQWFSGDLVRPGV